MNTKMKQTARILSAMALMAGAGFAQAGTATANLTVGASVAANCTISTTAITFGAYDPVSGGNVSASGTVVVGCTKNATGLWVGLGNGSNFASSTRNLLGGTNADKLAYALRQPSATTPDALCSGFGVGTAWSNSVGTALNLSTSPGKAERTYKVCGEIVSGQDVSVDTYADTVVATINF